jgi:hypothetical protein
MSSVDIDWLPCAKLGMDFQNVTVKATVHGGSWHPQDAGVADGRWCEDVEVVNIDDLWAEFVDYCASEEPESVNTADGYVWWDGEQMTKRGFHNVLSQAAEDWINKEFA